MNRVLISWIGTRNDLKDDQANPAGPTFRFHENFFQGYSKHLLLTTESETDEISAGKIFYSSLVREFKHHKIELRYMGIPQRDVIDVNSLHASIYPILYEHRDHQLDIFISPGTATMQVVWYLVHLEKKFKTRLLQSISPEVLGKKEPELIQVKFQNSVLVDFLLMQEERVRSEPTDLKRKNYCITKSLEPIYKLGSQVALTNKTTILIYGETGTGKEHLAKEVHNKSKRKNENFVTVNCGAFNSDLLESRLFGFEKGAFTGALNKTDGYFQAANKGTIFLDEIGDINGPMQAALLRVIQNGEVQRVGSTVIEKIDIRIIAATNKNLSQECKNGHFRWDLYYRLSVVELKLPPLRQREDKEIVELFEFFNNYYANEFKRTALVITPEANKILCDYPWPGNVRQLQNFLERMYAHGTMIIEPSNLRKEVEDVQEFDSQNLEDVKRFHVKNIVNYYGGNLTKAKKALGIGSVNSVKKYLL